jgi:hypothetical protein
VGGLWLNGGPAVRLCRLHRNVRSFGSFETPPTVACIVIVSWYAASGWLAGWLVTCQTVALHTCCASCLAAALTIAPPHPCTPVGADIMLTREWIMRNR